MTTKTEQAETRGRFLAAIVAADIRESIYRAQRDLGLVESLGEIEQRTLVGYLERYAIDQPMSEVAQYYTLRELFAIARTDREERVEQ